MLASHGRWLAKSVAKGSASDRPRVYSVLIYRCRARRLPRKWDHSYVVDDRACVLLDSNVVVPCRVMPYRCLRVCVVRVETTLASLHDI